MFILGVLSLVQIIFLPGLISLRLIRFRGTFWQGVIYTFALSLLINYCMVFLLAAFHLYSRPSILIFFAAQVIWAVWLYRKNWQRPLLDIFEDVWGKSISALADLFPFPKDDLSRSEKAAHYAFILFTLISLIFALDRTWWFVQAFLNNLGTVFDGWDAVYQWNRWAEVWFSGKIPLDSRFYPQLVPINWSLTYMFMGGSTVQLFAKSMMPLFAIGILLQFFDLGLTLQQPGFFVAIILSRSLFVRFIESGLTNGYADTAAAFFVLLPLYTIFKVSATKTESEQHLSWILGFFFAAAAAVTKQPGVYIFILYPFLVYAFLLHPNAGNRINSPTWHSMLTWGAVAALIPLIWYGFKFVLVARGIDSSEVLANAGYAAGAYGNAGLISQIVRSLQRFGAYLILFPLILFALPWLPSLIRWLFFLFILPFPILWAVMASYDTRNLAIVLTALALAGGLAIELIVHFLLKLSMLARIEKWNFVLVPAALIVLLFVLAHYYPDTRIQAIDMTARQNVFSQSLNKELRHLVLDDPNTLILTNYPVAYVLGHDNSQVSFWYTDPKEFQRLMQNDKITHLLVPSTGVDARITNQIEQWTQDGQLTFVLQDKGSSVIPYKLYAVMR